MSNQLTQMYQAILATAWATPDENGRVFSKVIGKTEQTSTPFKLGELQIVLPTTQALRNFNASTDLLFNPLSENPVQGESAILEKIRRAISVRLNYVTAHVATSLLTLAVSVTEHSKLDPDQAELLSLLRDATKTTFETFLRLQSAAISEGPDRSFIRFYLRRGAKVRGEAYSRACITSFPLYEKIVSSEDKRVSKKDAETLKRLFEFIFPDINVPERYSFGSNSSVAPFTEAYLGGILELIACLNDVISRYKGFIENPDELMIEADWATELANIPSMLNMIRSVPRQVAAEGNEKRKEAEVQSIQQPPAATNVYVPPTAAIAAVAPVAPVESVKSVNPVMGAMLAVSKPRENLANTNMGMPVAENKPAIGSLPTGLVRLSYEELRQRELQQRMAMSGGQMMQPQSTNAAAIAAANGWPGQQQQQPSIPMMGAVFNQPAQTAMPSLNPNFRNSMGGRI